MRIRKMYIIVIAFMGVIVIGLLGEYIYNTYQIRSVYEEARKLISSECYEEAFDKLKTIKYKYYKDSEDLEKINSFKEDISQEYSALIKQEVQEEVKKYDKGVTPNVPYVGMSEKSIAKTRLGAPSPEVRHNKEWVDGEYCTANLYDFYEGSGMIFSARCVKGEVIQVWDYRDEPITKRNKNYNSNNVKDESDPYGASDYSDPEDFYYDYYDDFWDYEEAEDYWYEFSDE